MTETFNLLKNFWLGIFDLLSNVTFELFGFNVDLLSVLFALFVFSMVIVLFYKGARA